MNGWWTSFRRTFWVLLFMFAGTAGPSAQSVSQLQGASDNSDIAQTLQYGTNLPQLLEDPAIVAALARGEMPHSVAREQQRLQDLLVSLGYLDAQLIFDLAAPLPDQPDQPVRIIARIDSGPQYRVGGVRIALGAVTDPALASALSDAAAFAIGQIIRASVLHDVQSRVIWQLGEAGYPFASISQIDVLPDRINGEAQIEIQMAAGKVARFGGVSYDRVPSSFMDRVQQAQPFQDGDLFSSHKFDEFRAVLANLPNTRRARAEIVPLSNDHFGIEVQVRSAGVSSFSESGTILGVAVLTATLFVIALSLLIRSAREGQGRSYARALNAVIAILTIASLTLVVGRAASLV